MHSFLGRVTHTHATCVLQSSSTGAQGDVANNVPDMVQRLVANRRKWAKKYLKECRSHCPQKSELEIHVFFVGVGFLH